MVASNARAVLKKENELLDELAQKTSVFAKNAVGVEADVFNGWARYFRRHREMNDELIRGDDAAFDRELKKEIKLLESLHSTIAGGTPIEKSRKANHGEDIEIAKHLI
jgi:hypothetical protein